MPKNARLTGIKALRCYRVEEAAEVSGVSPRTIRNWIADGLPVLDGERPMLIRGDDLQDYIKGTRASRKVSVALGEFYCLACRKARKPAGGFADCTIKDGRAMLTALCEVCEIVVHKPVSVGRIREIARLLDLTTTPHPLPDAPARKEA
ncbi:Helix-turn-helix domain protein [Roseivivax jejudonensis]|uniref:Helix-turn-helix domain protein n=1 Tax=Roseivivax jejudonensis TaxID=1529041 RepID=A0A1X6Z5T1_9RHOB|nr:helix-turn-helix domain-containing protein [Roseivivax jejudonensis]SLN41794.1 Helix-turn-helix domain protein [Roseivivax jejudonensis]